MEGLGPEGEGRGRGLKYQAAETRDGDGDSCCNKLPGSRANTDFGAVACGKTAPLRKTKLDTGCVIILQ